MWILGRFIKPYYWSFSQFSDPPKIPSQDSFDTQFFFCGYFLTAIKAYFSLKTFKDHIRPENDSFHILRQFIKRNRFTGWIRLIDRSTKFDIALSSCSYFEIILAWNIAQRVIDPTV